jgi:hypothetical protein
MKKMINATMPCAPKIWKKFSKEQKKLFVEINQIFVDELTILMTMRPPVISGSVQIAAHNLACEAVWKMVEDNINRRNK